MVTISENNDLFKIEKSTKFTPKVSKSNEHQIIY